MKHTVTDWCFADKPHWDVHYQEKSSRHQSDAGRCTAHLGHCKRPPGCRCHGAHPGQQVGDRLRYYEWLQVFINEYNALLIN